MSSAVVVGTVVPPAQGTVVQPSSAETIVQGTVSRGVPGPQGTVVQQRRPDVPSFYGGLQHSETGSVPPAQGVVSTGTDPAMTQPVVVQPSAAETVAGPAMAQPVVVQPSAEAHDDGKAALVSAITVDLPTATPLDMGPGGTDSLQPVIAQPVIGQPVGGGVGAAYGPGIPSGALGRWLTDPFDAWCSSGDVCCTSTFCICIPLGWAADEVGQDGNFVRCLSGGFAFINLITEGPLVFSFWPWCCFLKMCAMTGNATLITATRARTSTRDHIPIDSCDSGFSFCCGPCAVAQMTVHNQRRQALALAEAGGIQGSAAVAHELSAQQRELRAQLDARDARSQR